jgi:hypothetical protein
LDLLTLLLITYIFPAKILVILIGAALLHLFRGVYNTSTNTLTTE